MSPRFRCWSRQQTRRGLRLNCFGPCSTVRKAWDTLGWFPEMHGVEFQARDLLRLLLPSDFFRRSIVPVDARRRCVHSLDWRMFSSRFDGQRTASHRKPQARIPHPTHKTSQSIASQGKRAQTSDLGAPLNVRKPSSLKPSASLCLARLCGCPGWLGFIGCGGGGGGGGEILAVWYSGAVYVHTYTYM